MNKRVLVIEDQEDNRQILRDLLTSANFGVIEAEDGEAGLTAAAAHRPDLILMDIQLSGLDGYEATRRIKADALLRATDGIHTQSRKKSPDSKAAEQPWQLQGSTRSFDAVPGPSNLSDPAIGRHRVLQGSADECRLDTMCQRSFRRQELADIPHKTGFAAH
jgi:two-component system cell cycle response regulator DivK